MKHHVMIIKHTGKNESCTMDVEFGNCCSSNGIKCGADNGHVIAVELDDSCLFGLSALTPTSSILSIYKG